MTKDIFKNPNILYNIFKIMNTKTGSPEEKISRLLDTIGKPARLQILLAIGSSEACVCHLEAKLGMRQAYISQHLMAMRKAGVLISRRSGKYIFYSLRDPHLLDIIHQAGNLVGISPDRFEDLIPVETLPQCECPNCTPPPSPLPAG